MGLEADRVAAQRLMILTFLAPRPPLNLRWLSNVARVKGLFPQTQLPKVVPAPRKRPAAEASTGAVLIASADLYYGLVHQLLYYPCLELVLLWVLGSEVAS